MSTKAPAPSLFENGGDVAEKRVVYATSEVGPFPMFTCIGLEMGKLKPGMRLRIYQYQRSTQTGDIAATQYMRESLQRGINGAIERLQLPLRTRWDGKDLLVERA